MTGRQALTALWGSAAVLAIIGIGIAPPVSPRAVLDLAGGTDVAIIVTDDGTNCGGPRGGCFRTDEPDAIRIGTRVAPGAVRYIVLHEYAHVLQHRARQPLDECQADAYAKERGARPMESGSPYAVECLINLH